MESPGGNCEGGGVGQDLGVEAAKVEGGFGEAELRWGISRGLIGV